MQLANKLAGGAWRLADGWQKYLVERGEELEARIRLRALVGEDASRYRILRREDPVPVVEGVVVAKGLHDELTGEVFAAVKTVDGHSFYVRLPAQIAETLQERDAVRVGFDAEPWLKPADRIVARFAQENGGVYDPVRHERALEALRQPRASDQPSPAQRVAANVRRLERLARYRLATCLPDGRWQIPADLLSQLEARERTHPQHRLRFEKLEAPTREPVRPRAPDAAAEREMLGRALSKEMRLAYVAEPPVFTGRVMACAPTPSGREYLRIVDQRNGRFTLVARGPAAQRLEGRTVAIARGGDGRLSVRFVPEISR